jgi:hypothetical protein
MCTLADIPRTPAHCVEWAKQLEWDRYGPAFSSRTSNSACPIGTTSCAKNRGGFMEKQDRRVDSSLRAGGELEADAETQVQVGRQLRLPQSAATKVENDVEKVEKAFLVVVCGSRLP